MRINTNISAVIANKNLQSAQNKVSSSLEKLSSGFKINHAADDAAGMAIAAKLRSQIRGLEQSSQNASDGISVVQTAEGALAEVENMLQRIRELSVQAANGIYVDEDRDALQAEVDSLLAEVDRISNDTEFNKKPLLDGSLDRRSYTNQDGIRVSYASPSVPADKYEITITKMGTQAEINGGPIALAAGDVITEDQAGVIKINDYDININAGDTTEEVYAKITEAADRLNLTVEGFTAGELSFRTYEYGSNERITFDISNAELATALGLQTGYDVAGTNVEADFGGAREGFTETATMYCYGNSVTVTDLGGFKLEYEVEDDYADVGNPVTAEVTDIGTMTIHIGANEGQVPPKSNASKRKTKNCAKKTPTRNALTRSCPIKEKKAFSAAPFTSSATNAAFSFNRKASRSSRPTSSWRAIPATPSTPVCARRRDALSNLTARKRPTEKRSSLTRS